MSEEKADQLDSRFWNHKRIAALGTATLMIFAFPIYIDQGYVRYNAYVLPCLGLCAVILYVIFILTIPTVSEYIRSIYKLNHIVGLVLFLFLLGGLLVGITKYFFMGLNLSKQHMQEAQREDSAAKEAKKEVSKIAEDTKSVPTQLPIPAKHIAQQLSIEKPAKIGVGVPTTPLVQPQTTVFAPNGIGIGGSNFGTATVNNYVPPSRVLSDDALIRFAKELSTAKGAISVVPASTADDVFPLSQQICQAASIAQWARVCPMTRNSVFGHEVVAQGIVCYSNDWESDDAAAFKNAMKVVNLTCKYIAHGYDFGDGMKLGETDNQVTLIIGSPMAGGPVISPKNQQEK